MALIKEFDPDSGKTYDKMGLPISSNILYALIALKMHICLEKTLLSTNGSLILPEEMRFVNTFLLLFEFKQRYNTGGS